jgi:hypothetical protein
MKLNPYILVTGFVALLLASCSSTKSIPDNDQLYVGLEKTQYDAPERGEHYNEVTTELDAALATPPNAALFGSSSVRSPFPIGLWIWNEFANSKSGLGQWILKSFGSRPVLMSWVNPELRASVASEVLRRHGYFRGHVGYEVLTQHNPKKAKIRYDVSMDHLFTIDSVSYLNFPAEADSLIQASSAEAKIRPGDAFDITFLDAERQRISQLFRNNGFFYYQPSYASYLADTVTVPGKVLLHFQMADNLPEIARRKWYVGRVDLQLRHQFMEQLNDSVRRRVLTIHFNGRRPPIRPRVILSSMKLRPGQLYSYKAYQESASQLSSSGLFSTVDFNFTPRDTTGLCDTLDLALNCVFDKPYDFYVTGNVTGKTNNRLGPGIVLGLTKRNAFRGGEILDFNLKGNYEWQTGHHAEGTNSRFNSYEYGFDASLTFPRLVIPWAKRFRRHRYYTTPTTLLKVSSDVINCADYFKRHVVSGEWTYSAQTSATSRHQFSPLVFSYEYMRSTTHAFDSIVSATPYLYYTMQDQFVPKMQYVYTYTSPSTYANPIWWQTTVSEAGNLISLGYMTSGEKWGDKGKKMFKNPYAQFFKIETELVKTWRLSEHSTLVGHVDAGAIWTFGNSEDAPYNEQFYVGGANSIRAFTVRSIGPGSYHNDASAGMYYLDQTGDMKLLANLEYRPRLFGNLYGAVFMDAGNVWTLRKDDRDEATFKMKNALKEMALGTGVGLRYDMDFLVIRLDWGVGLHLPYKSGFYNVGNFRDSQSIHFAIGYPF